MTVTLEERIRAYAATLDAATPRPSDPPAPIDRELVEVAEPVPAEAPRRDRRLVAVAAIAAVAILAGAVAALTLGGHDGHDRVSTVTSVAHATTTVEPTTVVPTTAVPTTTAQTTTTPAPTAADSLAPFFDGAAAIDQRLKTAAADINADLGPATVHFRPSTVAALKTADPSAIAKTIPAGLPPALERAVLVVFSELDSRYMSMCAWGTGTESSADLTLQHCFVNGAPAAARFATDLASAHTIASTMLPVTPAAPDSRIAAELQLQLDVIYENNAGCAATGGFIVSQLAPVVWRVIPTGMGPADGTVAGMQFQASYDAASGWTTRLLVC